MSWGRWLSGETWIPLASVNALAALCGADQRRLEILWELADQARRSALTDPAPATLPASVDPVPDSTSGDPSADAAVTVPPVPDSPDSPEIRGAEPQQAPLRIGRWALMLGAVITCTTVAGTAGILIGSSLRAETDHRPAGPGGQASPTGPGVLRAPAPVPGQPGTAEPVKTTTRSEVIARARSWKPRSAARIPYSQTGMYQGYRTDGSGYAAMALGLPGPGPNSTGLAWGTYSQRIPVDRLLPGDLIINTTGDSNRRQVIIFEKWAKPDRRSYWAYQQRRGYGTDHLVLRDGLTKGGNYYAYRPPQHPRQAGELTPAPTRTGKHPPGTRRAGQTCSSTASCAHSGQRS